jgi:hypothetical protein
MAYEIESLSNNKETQGWPADYGGGFGNTDQTITLLDEDNKIKVFSNLALGTCTNI